MQRQQQRVCTAPDKMHAPLGQLLSKPLTLISNRRPCRRFLRKLPAAGSDGYSNFSRPLMQPIAHETSRIYKFSILLRLLCQKAPAARAKHGIGGYTGQDGRTLTNIWQWSIIINSKKHNDIQRPTARSSRVFGPELAGWWGPSFRVSEPAQSIGSTVHASRVLIPLA
jgi:hypothetical protein